MRERKTAIVHAASALCACWSSCWRSACGRATARGCSEWQPCRLTRCCWPRCRSSRGSSRCPRSSPCAGVAPRAKRARSRSRWRSSPAPLRRDLERRERCSAARCGIVRACAAAARSRIRIVAAGAGPAAGASGVAGGHRAAAGTAPQAAHRVRTQDARAHRIRPASRRGGRGHSAAGAAVAACVRVRACLRPRWCS